MVELWACQLQTACIVFVLTAEMKPSSMPRYTREPPDCTMWVARLKVSVCNKSPFYGYCQCLEATGMEGEAGIKEGGGGGRRTELQSETDLSRGEQDQT